MTVLAVLQSTLPSFRFLTVTFLSVLAASVMMAIPLKLNPLSQVPKRVVSKRVVLADVPLYRHFVFLTFWFFYVLAVRRCLPPQRGGDPDQVFSLN